MSETPYTQQRKEREKKLNLDKAQRLVTKTLLFVHYGVIVFTTTKGLSFAFSISDNTFHFLTIAVAVIAEDLVLFAAAEGIRKGTYIGRQKVFAILAYVIAFLGVLVTMQAASNGMIREEFITIYLPFSGPLMAAIAIVLLCTDFQTQARNERKAADMQLAHRQYMDETAAMNLTLDRAAVDRRHARDVNKDYDKALKEVRGNRSSVEMLQASAQVGLEGIHKMLQLNTGGGDGKASKVLPVVSVPIDKEEKPKKPASGGLRVRLKGNVQSAGKRLRRVAGSMFRDRSGRSSMN